MLQCRRNEPHRRRQIKRDNVVNVTDKKGVAGIRTSTNPEDELASQMANLQVDRRQTTLRNLVDLGAASTGAHISINADHDDADELEEDSDTNVV